MQFKSSFKKWEDKNEVHLFWGGHNLFLKNLEKLYVVLNYILSKIEFLYGCKICNFYFKFLSEILVLSLDSWSVIFFLNV